MTPARTLSNLLVPLVAGVLGASFALAIFFGLGFASDDHGLCPLPAAGVHPHQCGGRP